MKTIALAAAVLLAACSGPQTARMPPTFSSTASNGGADAYMHVQPRAMSDVP